jgi:hypothetical protein
MNISEKAHIHFISCSLDDNQVHTNVSVAKSLGATSKIVHGIHQILFILEQLKFKEKDIIDLNFNFLKPLSVGQEFNVSKKLVGKKVYVSIENSFTQFSSGYLELEDDPSNFSELNNHRQLIQVFYNLPRNLEFIELEKIFLLYPWLKENFSLFFLKTLIYVSYYFGVEISSKNTMIINVQMRVNNSFQNNKIQTFKKQNGQAELITIQTHKWTIKAIGRRYVLYASDDLTLDLNLGKYGGQNALVFGATGSLGGTIAKLLIRDRSQVHGTYRSDLKLHETFPYKSNNFIPWKYDVLKNELPEIYKITHIYYLITPDIFLSNKPDFSIDFSGILHTYYVEHLKTILQKYSSNSLKYIFSPSTMAIEEPTSHLKEYINVKQEMEIFLDQFSILNPNLTVSYPRIEMFKSQQTVNIPQSLKTSPSEIAYKYLPFTS